MKNVNGIKYVFLRQSTGVKRINNFISKRNINISIKKPWNRCDYIQLTKIEMNICKQ